MMSTNVTAVLTIAGSDSSGGAGIQADLRTFAAHGCYGTSALTATTAQNTTGVQAVHGMPPEFIVQQIRSVLDDIDVRAIKTGMLFTAENVKAITSTLREHFESHGRIPLVCDPVCVSTSGHVLLQPDAIKVIIEELFPVSNVITPNKLEAELLLKERSLPCKIASLGDMLVAAQNLLAFGSEAVLLKGGHISVSEDDIRSVQATNIAALDVNLAFLLVENMEILQQVTPRSQSTPTMRSVTPSLFMPGKTEGITDLVVDVLCQRGVTGQTITLYPRPRLQSKSTHGTGCTLSAALACALGNGVTMKEATAQATWFTHLGIETAPPIGKGYGPLNHLHSVSRLIVQPRTPGHPYPLTHKFIQSTANLWRAYVQHDFVVQLGKGTLDRSSFIHFIKQDYLYLKYYSRAYAFLAAKSHDFAPISSAAGVVLSISAESSMHVSFCTQFGITREELETTPESPATTAYGAYLIDMGLQGDTTKLLVALAACLLGYGEVGLWLKKEAGKPNSWVKWQDNPYLKWLEDYAGEVFQNAVSTGLEMIEARAAADPPSAVRYAEWLAVWEKCVGLEKGFWDMAMNLS